MLNKIRTYYLEITVFVCGAVVMVLELVGSRVLAPFVGTSIFVWTSLVGVILASLSFGYYFGGRLADRRADRETLSNVILVSGILIAITGLTKTPVLDFLTNIRDVRISSILGLIILFAPANVLLGVISPYAAKLKMKDVEHTGRVFGDLYALSTAGSITGTFVTGFWLITLFGNSQIIYGLALVLLLCSALVSNKRFTARKAILGVLMVLLSGVQYLQKDYFERNGYVDLDTPYQRVQIFTTEYRNRPVRYLKTDAFGIQSGAYLDSNELLFDYTNLYELAFYRRQPSSTLMIGGGAYSYPKYFLSKHRNSTIDVVEIDPALHNLAHRYFNLEYDPRLKIISEDGRTYLNSNQKIYGAILIDAFHSLTPPFQLTTKEAVQKIYEGLSEDGVVILNLIGSIEGKNGMFVRAEYATYRSVFPSVDLYPISDSKNGLLRQNIILVASKEPTRFSNESVRPLYQRWTKPVALDVPPLTDEHAPVEQYLAGLYKEP